MRSGIIIMEEVNIYFDNIVDIEFV